ncbi:MAG: heavy metal translocating P-type ATPase [Phycisphaeraceae bacterium]|nr:heavy metal translocating P-type ATPase [Phycisphaeraceae bacterium]
MSTAAIRSIPDRQMSSRVLCAHCGLTVSPSLVREGLEHQFCCHGCETVFSTIQSCGLADYYRLRDTTTDVRVRSDVADHAFAEFDDSAFHAVYVRTIGDSRRIELLLENVHCAACVWLVERLPHIVPGVLDARLNLRRKELEVCWQPDAVHLSRIASTLNRLGYQPHPARGVNARESQRREQRRMLSRIAIAGFCAGNVMLLAFALYGGQVDAIEPRFEQVFRVLSMLIACVSLAWPGSVFYRGAIASLRARVPHLDLPIAIALSFGGLWGIVNTVRGTGEIFFDSLTVLVFLLLVGRFIQMRQQAVAADHVELLFAHTPSNAHLVEVDRTRTVPIQALRIGDLIEVRANESIAVDGEIVEGRSDIDTSLMTGESRAIAAEAGTMVTAGTINLTSPIRVRALATGDGTRIARLMRLVADAAERRAPIVTLANRIAIVFTIVVLFLATLTFAIWSSQGLDGAVEHAIALLIVTCPCALGLATPMAMTAAIGRAARHGIMIKGGDALERLSRPSCLILDKTGTITEGSLQVVDWIGNASIRPHVAAIERTSSHPVARALADVSPPADTMMISNIKHTPGAGIAAEIDGSLFLIGSPSYVLNHCLHSNTTLEAAADSAARRGQTPIAIARDGTLQAVAVLADRVRDDSASTIRELASRGWSLSMLSGDDEHVTQYVASLVGIDHQHAIGSVSPEEKLRHIQEFTRPVVMVGDGVNDAAALAAADVGIAVHGGAEASLEAADVYLARPGLGPILAAIDLASCTRRTILICMGVSLTYNFIAASIAMAGHLTALLAAILMPISSLTVVAIASRAGARVTRTLDIDPPLSRSTP